MQHSLIVRFFKRIFETCKEYYKLSLTRKMFNNASKTIRNIFLQSFIHKILISKNNSYINVLRFSVIGKTEVILQKILKLLHSFYYKGVQGSLIFKVDNSIKTGNKKNIIECISFVIIGVVLAFILFGYVNRSLYVFQLYIGIIMLFLAINIYLIDISNIYKNSFVKKVIDTVFEYK